MVWAYHSLAWLANRWRINRQNTSAANSHKSSQRKLVPCESGLALRADDLVQRLRISSLSQVIRGKV